MKIFICSLFFLLFQSIAFGQTTYTWVPAGGGSWATSTNWSPNRTAPAANDILVFNNGGTKTIINVPTQTIGALLISNNSNITLDGLNAGGPGKTLTIGNVTGIDFSITNGSSLTNIGTLDVIALSTNSTSDISGTLYVVAGKVFNTDATGVVTTVTGTINNLGTVTCTNATRLLFQSVGTYIHRIDAGTIPIATWGLTTNCNITGVTNTAPAGLDQAFGNFTWNCLGHSNLINLNSALRTINGNFTISNAGQFNSGNGRTQNGLALSSNSNVTLNVGGNFNIEQNSTEASWFLLTAGSASVIMNVGGNFNMSRAGSGPVYFDCYVGTTLNTIILNITGNYVQTGGWFDWALTASASGSNFAIMNLTGNFTHSGTSVIVGTTTDAGTPNGKIIFTGGGTSTFSSATPGNIAYTNFEVASGKTLDVLSNISLTSHVTPAIWGGRFEILGGATLDMNTFQIVSSSGAVAGSNNAFILNSTAKVITANINGLQNTTIGSVSTSIATRTYNSGADYTYDGTVNQNSGLFTTTPTVNTVNNLTINNSSGIAATGVTLQQNFNVNGTLDLQLGHFTSFLDRLITLNASGTLVGGTDNSFVNGPMRKVGNTDFTFPVGKLIVSNSYNPSGFAGGWRPIGILNATGGSVTDSYTAEYFINNAGLIGAVTSPGLLKVNPCEYWGLKRDAANTNTNVGVTLHWKAKSDCNPGAYIINPFAVTAALSSTGVPLINGSGPWDYHNGNGVGTQTEGSVTYSSVSSTLMSSFTGGTYGEFTPFAIGSTNLNDAPLPFELKIFNAKTKDQSVNLEWLVNKNDLVKKFTIERSKDGYHFESLKTVNAVIGVQSASYTDKDLLPFSGWSYYRLRITNLEGKDVFSSAQKVWVGKSGYWLQVSPKPAKEKLLVNLAAPERITELSIINSMGQVMYKLTRLQSMNQLDISQLKPGIYYVRVIGVDGSFTDNFIKQ